MLNTNHSNVHSGKLPLWAFVVFGITLLLAVVCTWLITWKLCTASAERVYNTLEKSLQASQMYLNGDIRGVDHELQKKLYDPASREKANIWKPMSDSAITMMNQLNNYINIVKLKVKKENILETEERKQLLDSIKFFCITLSSFLPQNSRESLGELPAQKLLDFENKADNWIWLFTKESNSNRLLLLLTKLQFEVSASTYIISDFCNQQVRSSDDGYDVFDVLIGQNAQQLLPGKKLKITAGVGTYSSRAQPEIIIDGTKQDLNANGFVLFEKKVSKSGRIPVSVTYKDPLTGEVKNITTNVDYAVATPLN